MENKDELQDRIDAIKSQIKNLQDTQAHIQNIIDTKFPTLIGSLGQVPPEESTK